MSKEVITYEKVLDQLQDQEAHLLLGNGFNLSLGIKTDYQSIFKKMSENYPQYKDLNMEKNQFDIETVIGELKEKIKKPDVFLPKFIHNKIKLDFMKATSEIVVSEIKNIFQSEKQEKLHLLLKNFNNYFTLNYDPFLYILLMIFKSNNDAFVFQDKHKVKVVELNQDKHKVKVVELNKEIKEIYDAIKRARENGTSTIKSEDNQAKYDLSNSNKADFERDVTRLFNKKNWKQKDIKQAVTYLLQEESGINGSLGVNDGFLNGVFQEKSALLKEGILFPDDIKKDFRATSQNLFFLHGAFHIYKSGNLIKKIEREENITLYKKLEQIIYREEKEIILIFSNDDKKKQIQKDSYLKRGYEKLAQLRGAIVVIGSSFDDNDSHIFYQIKESRINKIYVACEPSNKKIDSFCNKVKGQLGDKNIIFFDRDTLSYLP